MLTSRLDAYISKYGDFCAHDDNDNNDDNDKTDYFTPSAHARGVTTCMPHLKEIFTADKNCIDES